MGRCNQSKGTSMTDKEAMNLALEALMYASYEDIEYNDACAAKVLEARNALKEALAQSEQEPVAWMSPSWIDPDTRGWQSDSFESIPIEGWLPIYTTPPQRTWVGLTEQEHTDIAVECGCMSADWVFYGAAVERKVKERNT